MKCWNLWPWGNYGKWNKSKTNIIWFHLYVESIFETAHIHREQSDGCQRWGLGECEIGEAGVKWYKLPVIK